MPSLIICEKPRVAEKVALALAEDGVKKKSLHDVTYYEVERKGRKLVIAPAAGHIYTLRQTTKGSNYPVFDVEWAPSWKVDREAKFTKAYLQVLESLAKKSDEYINSCDYDIEGALIGYNIIRYACTPGMPAKRMKFSALTKEDIVEAYENRFDLDVPNALAGETRHILDWFYGINLSRALMHAVRRAGAYRVMSIGRVQGPALAILAQREQEIINFKPQPYWQLFALYKGLRFQHEVEKFFKREEAEERRRLSEANMGNAVVERVQRSQRKIPPNPPFDLTGLQVEAFRALGFSPSMTQELAQSLYEASLISYPRTSSQKLPAKLNLPKIISQLGKNPAYAALAQKLISQSKFRPREGEKEDPAHPAIHPTGLQPTGKIHEREAKLYDLIVKRFLACFADSAVREGMRVDIRLGQEKYFITGARTLSPGWFDFYQPYVKFEEVTLPDFREASIIAVEKIEMEQKETQPPKRYTEASIIQALEKKNLGTKSTRAVVIDALRKRGYMKGRTSLTVTPFGLSVFRTLEHHAKEILDEQLTREFEQKMDAIAEGKADPAEIIREGKRVLSVTLEKFKREESAIGKELTTVLVAQRAVEEILGRCPACDMGDIKIIRSRATRKQFAACSRYPDCTKSYPLPQVAQIIRLNKVCEFDRAPWVRVRRKGKREFEMCLDPNCPTKAEWKNKAPSVKMPEVSKASKAPEPTPKAGGAK